jgi:hypothetical protein
MKEKFNAFGVFLRAQILRFIRFCRNLTPQQQFVIFYSLCVSLLGFYLGFLIGMRQVSIFYPVYTVVSAESETISSDSKLMKQVLDEVADIGSFDDGGGDESEAGSNFRENIRDLMRMADSFDREIQIIEQLSEWALEDPLGALRYSIKLPDPQKRGIYAPAILKSWARNDLSAAWNYAWGEYQKGNPELVRVVAVAAVTQDRGLAVDFLGQMDSVQLPTGELYNRLISDALVSGEVGFAQDLVLNIRNLNARRSSIVLMAGSMGKRAMDASRWLMELNVDDATLISAFSAYTQARAQLNPHATAEWAMNLSSQLLRRQAVADAVAVWSKQDLVAAAQWLNKYNTSDVDLAIQNLVSYSDLGQISLDTALDWAESIKDNVRRLRTIERILKKVSRKNVTPAYNYLKRSQILSDDEKNYLVDLIEKANTGD